MGNGVYECSRVCVFPFLTKAFCIYGVWSPSQTQLQSFQSTDTHKYKHTHQHAEVVLLIACGEKDLASNRSHFYPV